jgi:hypothetical protein
MRDQEMMHAPLQLYAACDRQFSRAARQVRLTLELGRQFLPVTSQESLFQQARRTTHKLSHPFLLANTRHMESCMLSQPEIMFPMHPNPSAAQQPRGQFSLSI